MQSKFRQIGPDPTTSFLNSLCEDGLRTKGGVMLYVVAALVVPVIIGLLFYTAPLMATGRSDHPNIGL